MVESTIIPRTKIGIQPLGLYARILPNYRNQRFSLHTRPFICERYILSSILQMKPGILICMSYKIRLSPIQSHSSSSSSSSSSSLSPSFLFRWRSAAARAAVKSPPPERVSSTAGAEGGGGGGAPFVSGLGVLRRLWTPCPRMEARRSPRPGAAGGRTEDAGGAGGGGGEAPFAACG